MTDAYQEATRVARLTPYERFREVLDGRDHATVDLGLFGPYYRGWLHLNDGGGSIHVTLHGHEIAGMAEKAVVLHSRGHGHSATTRAALSECAPSRVYSYRRKLYVGDHPFRDGITLDWSGRVIHTGWGPHVDGAPPRRSRSAA